MLKQVYDPTEDRKHKSESPLNSEAIKEKIQNNQVKVKGKQRRAKREEKPATAEPQPAKEPEKPKAPVREPAIKDEQFLQALKEIGKPATSREISDKLGISDPDVGRQLVRSRMAKLAEEGKVVINEAPKGTRADKVYNVKTV